MNTDLTKHVKPIRLGQLPADLRQALREARLGRGWSQRKLGEYLGLPQMHISGIESGKIVPRFDTLLDYVRALDYDLLLIPRLLVPAVLALVREHQTSKQPTEEEDHPLYAVSEADKVEAKKRNSDES